MNVTELVLDRTPSMPLVDKGQVTQVPESGIGPLLLLLSQMKWQSEDLN